MIQTETDPMQRDQMIREAFKIHADDVGHIPLHRQALAWADNKNVSLVQLPNNVMLFNRMTRKTQAVAMSSTLAVNPGWHSFSQGMSGIRVAVRPPRLSTPVPTPLMGPTARVCSAPCGAVRPCALDAPTATPGPAHATRAGLRSECGSGAYGWRTTSNGFGYRSAATSGVPSTTSCSKFGCPALRRGSCLFRWLPTARSSLRIAPWIA